eukprot:gene15906-biopygen11825
MVGRGCELSEFAGAPAGEALGERRRPEEREEGSDEVRMNREGREGKEQEEQEDAKDAKNLSMLNLEQRKQLMVQIKQTKKELDAMQKSGWGGMESAIARWEGRLQSLRAQLAALEPRPMHITHEFVVDKIKQDASGLQSKRSVH